jgi:hypothetical protein
VYADVGMGGWWTKVVGGGTVGDVEGLSHREVVVGDDGS